MHALLNSRSTSVIISWLSGELVVQPDVAERQADLFEQMENQFQFGVDQRFAGDAAVENGDADNAFRGRESGTATCAPSSSNSFCASASARASSLSRRKIRPSSDKLAADAGIQRQFKMFEQAGRKADGGRGAQAGGRLPARGASASGAHGRFRKMAARLTLRDFAEKQQELFQHRLGVQRMGQDGRKIAQHVEGLRRVDEPAVQEVRHGAGRTLAVTTGGGWAGALSRRTAHKRSSSEFRSRARTGLVSTWVTPCRKASSSQSDWLAAV